MTTHRDKTPRPGLLLVALLLCGGCGGSPEKSVAAAHEQYELFPMLEKYVGEERGAGHYQTVVRYLGPEERAKAEVRVKDGLLVDIDGKPLDPDLTRRPARGGMAIYVMDGDGRIYSSFDPVQGEFHHSSLVAGAPVAAAGDMTVVEGRLHEISNMSGHYRPPRRSLDQILARLRELGIDLSEVRITIVGEEGGG